MSHFGRIKRHRMGDFYLVAMEPAKEAVTHPSTSISRNSAGARGQHHALDQPGKFLAEFATDM